MTKLQLTLLAMYLIVHSIRKPHKQKNKDNTLTRREITPPKQGHKKQLPKKRKTKTIMQIKQQRKRKQTPTQQPARQQQEEQQHKPKINNR